MLSLAAAHPSIAPLAALAQACILALCLPVLLGGAMGLLIRRWGY